jgi:stress response protein SCP2
MLDLNKPAPVGALDLSKGHSIDLAKPSGNGTFEVTATWKNKGGLLGGKKLDYDVYAHVAYTNGAEEVVNYANLTSRNGAVRHHGDLRTGGTEKISVRVTPDIAAVGFSFYSARENGTGSFADARAQVEIDNGEGSKVTLRVADMSVDARRYTLYFGTILNGGAEAVRLTAHEDYSGQNIERQPVLHSDGTHQMDAGPENPFKG